MSNINRVVESFTTVNLAQAFRMIAMCVKSNIVPLIKSSPGIGKSAIAAKYAKEHNLFMIDLRLTQCDTTDLNGFPFMDHATGMARYYPMETFPVLNTPFPTEQRVNDAGETYTHTYAGWLLFLDELTSATQSVQAAAYKLILDHMVGQHTLHPKVVKIAAGNLETDNAIVEPMSTALMSRMAHIYVNVNFKDWSEWAYNEGNIDPRIMAYLTWRPMHLYSFDPNVTHDTYACPRTWEFASRLLDQVKIIDPTVSVLLQGILGKGIGVEFCSFLRVFESLPRLEDIYANPTGIHLPSAPDVQYALVTALSQHLTLENTVPTIEFITRFPSEMQVICIKTAFRNKPLEERQKISSLPQMREFSARLAKVIFGN